MKNFLGRIKMGRCYFFAIGEISRYYKKYRNCASDYRCNCYILNIGLRGVYEYNKNCAYKFKRVYEIALLYSVFL